MVTSSSHFRLAGTFPKTLLHLCVLQRFPCFGEVGGELSPGILPSSKTVYKWAGELCCHGSNSSGSSIPRKPGSRDEPGAPNGKVGKELHYLNGFSVVFPREKLTLWGGSCGIDGLPWSHPQWHGPRKASYQLSHNASLFLLLSAPFPLFHKAQGLSSSNS